MNVGVIVGPSGAGKSTVAREVFGDSLVSGWPWADDRSILDGFPAALGIKDITGLLSSVGFSSPPYWVRPFHVLSNGQQFRVNLARTLAEMPTLAVVDEFTSVVDRTVAQIGSAAVAKTVRARGQKFVAVTCHYDVLDWLEPDWVYEPHTGELARGRLRRRPKIELEIVAITPAAWRLFKPHQPAAFTAVLNFPHPTHSGWREHRTVCLPDFQGVGVGNAMSEYIASLYVASGRPYTSTTSHPAMIAHRRRSPLWKCNKVLGMNKRQGLSGWKLSDRCTAGYSYIGPARPDDARRFGIIRDIEKPKASPDEERLDGPHVGERPRPITRLA